MPNWCENKLTVSGSAEELARFQAVAASRAKEGSVLSAESFLPYPEEFRKVDMEASRAYDILRALFEIIGNPEVFPMFTDGYNSGGYYWCVRNWGTKWDLSDVEFTCDNAALYYDFYTAWSAPQSLVWEMSRQFPSLLFRLDYAEPGCAVFGFVELQGGEVTDSGDGEEYRPECYQFDDEELSESCA